MSSGKKKHTKKRTYSAGEVERAIKQAGDEAMKRIMLICVASITDEVEMTDEKLEEFLNRMQRYIEYQQQGIIDLEKYSETIYKKTGIDLRLSRW